MNSTNQNRAFAKVLGLLGAGALTALMGLPAAAQSAPGTTQNTNPATTPSRTPTDPAFGNPNIVNPGSRGSSADESPMRGQTDRMDQAETPDGPSAVGEGVPGASETPSGSPSVPGTSGVDDPGQSSGSLPSERGVDRPSSIGRDDSMNNSIQEGMGDSIQEGPSAVEGETFPGPSETPSGSPSVPGNSEVDSPGANQNR